MLWLILVCFAVGAFTIMLFSKEGRGCIGGLIGLVILGIAVTALGAGVIVGILYLLANL